MIRRFFLASIFALLAALLLPVSSAHASMDDASKFIAGTGEQALTVMSNKSLSKEAQQQALQALFKKNVDIAWIGKFVLGKYYRQATDEQKQRYARAYEEFLTEHYTARFTEYTNQTFAVTNSRDDGNGRYYLTMEIKRPGQQSILVDYRVKESAGSYRIFDIVVEGISLITTQRSEFNSVISRNGLDYLITQLSAKDSALQKNALPDSVEKVAK